ncbi:hypothetical protein E4T56_gene5462 [Termitomyces sp. T112]|nr:hypothetical protein E4T56_gene5462 [Termitomyces sp. T112]
MCGCETPASLSNVKPIEGGVRILDDGIAIEWTDGHKSHFHISFLERYSSRENLVAFHKQVAKKPWNNRTITQTRDLSILYESLQTSEGMLAALEQICRYGLLFVKDVPHIETSDEKCELSTLADMFGHIRTTFYGRLWDVRNVRNSKNVAYTNLALGLHMDLLYLEHPPRYQILHCLRNRVQGGQSLFVDAIHCATLLQKTHPSDFDILATTPVAFHYVNDGHHLHREHPTIELADPASGSPPGMISHINYSPGAQAPLPLSTPDAFYPALKHFTEILNNPSNVHRYTLQEGDAVIFDNRRILHARTAFFNGRDKEGETDRWLKGCYLEADDLLDRKRVLEAKL